jgi:hypothetical protein
MTSSKLLKWAAAAVASAVLAGAVPAFASHTSHKRLAALDRPSHKVVHSATPTGSAKAHKLHARRGKHAKSLTASSGKHTAKQHRHHKASLASAHNHKHKASTLDKSVKTTSNM